MSAVMPALTVSGRFMVGFMSLGLALLGMFMISSTLRTLGLLGVVRLCLARRRNVRLRRRVAALEAQLDALPRFPQVSVSPDSSPVSVTRSTPPEPAPSPAPSTSPRTAVRVRPLRVPPLARDLPRLSIEASLSAHKRSHRSARS